MPGAVDSIGAARSVGEAWQGRGCEIAAGLRAFGDELHAAANKYAANEDAATRDLELRKTATARRWPESGVTRGDVGRKLDAGDLNPCMSW